MNTKPRWILSWTQGMFGLICLGVVLACDAGEGGESQITVLMGTPVIAEGTYQLDNLTLNDNGSLVSYSLTDSEGNKWTGSEYTSLRTELRWLGGEICPTATGKSEKCNAGSYQLSTSGSGFFFSRNAKKKWGLEARITSVNYDTDDSFGNSIALDGDTLAVGAPGEDSSQTTITNGTTASSNNTGGGGAVYVYRRTGTSWVQEAYIKTAGILGRGKMVLDGDTLVVGSWRYEAARGAVYIFRRTGNSWVQEARFQPFNKDYGHSNRRGRFGFSLALDGDTLAVGQPYESTDKPIILHGSATPTLSQVDDDEEIRKAGAVFVLRRNAENASWARESFIKSDDPDDYELFGMCLALLGDELMVADKYKIHKFKRHPDNSTWYRDDPKYYCEWYNCDCGYLSDSQKTYMPVDNNTVVLRDTSESDSSRYKVRIINRNGETYDFQSPKDYDDSFASNALALDGEHVAVAASSDSSYQTTITATADNKTDNNSYYSSTYQSGAVYVYRRNSDNLSWALEAYIKDENNTANRNFGKFSIALSGNRLAVYNPDHEVNVYRFLSRYKWSLNCPSVVTVQVVLNKNGELLRSKKTNSETCTYTDSPLTITPEEIKETWSKTDSGFKRVIEVLNSGVKYTRTYQYSRN